MLCWCALLIGNAPFGRILSLVASLIGEADGLHEERGRFRKLAFQIWNATLRVSSTPR